jgi:PKD repeat protein
MELEKLFLVTLVFLLPILALNGCMEQTAMQPDESFVSAENKPPIISDCKFEFVDNSSTVRFVGYALDFDGNVTSYFWSLSDGFTSDERSFVHTFSMPGRYYARLTVVDDVGARASKTICVTVD